MYNISNIVGSKNYLYICHHYMTSKIILFTSYIIIHVKNS